MRYGDGCHSLLSHRVSRWALLQGAVLPPQRAGIAVGCNRVRRPSAGLGAQGVKLMADAKTERLSSLLSQLSGKSPDKRIEAAAQIGSILARAGHSPRALIRALRDRSELVVVQAAESLGLIGEQAALRSLWMALKDPSGLV